MKASRVLLLGSLLAPLACSVEDLSAPPPGESPVGGGGQAGSAGASGAASGSSGATSGTGASAGSAGASAGSAGATSGSSGTAGSSGASAGSSGATSGSSGTAGASGATGGSSGSAGSSGAGQGGTAGAGGATGCATDEKPCGGSCVKKSDPAFGCDDATCMPCSATTDQTATCAGSACMTTACAAKTKNCNGDVSDACESNTDTDAKHCGACGKACSANHVAPTCQSGVCAGACSAGFGDCNMDLQKDGCEVDLLASADHCGDCSIACSVAAKGVCELGTCSNTRATWRMPNSPTDVTAGAPNPASLTDVGDGTIRDEVTKLAWAKAESPASGYAEALAACEALTLGGKSDWRLPSLVELFSILDVSQNNPAVDATKFPGTTATPQWTTGAVAAGFVDLVDFSFSQVASGNAGSTAPFRCVRSTVVSPTGGTMTSTDVVFDVGTNLIWQRAPGTTTTGWAAAKSTCAGLTIQGGGFRLPTVKELVTLLDPRASSPRIDTTDFPGAVGAPYWSASDIGNGRSYYVHFGDASVDSFHQVNEKALTRCVKNGP